jgi:cobalt-zinc-cadmium resistance protein CzcA
VRLPAKVSAQIGPDFSPIGSIYWYTLKSTNPAYDTMELKSLQDWVIAKYMKSVLDVVDDSSFGGITREYQVKVNPDKLIAYGLNLAQIETQLTNSNANGGGSFIEQGSQQINVRALGLIRTVEDVKETILKTQNGTPVRVKTSRNCARTEDPAWPDRQRIHRADGVVVDDSDVVEGMFFFARVRIRRRRSKNPRHGQPAEHANSAQGRKDRAVSGSDDRCTTPRTRCCTTWPKA